MRTITQKLNDKQYEGLQAMQNAILLPPVLCSNPTGVVVIDTETTGLDPIKDEILQISVIDGKGKTLLNEYVRPYWTDSWPEAARITGITPDRVADAKQAHDLIPLVRGIVDAANMVIGYDLRFDLRFLSRWGVSTETKDFVDVMQEFSQVYGEWDDYHGSFRWQKLTTAAAYYGYRYSAHDSLEDAKATLYVYRKMHP